MEAKLVRTETGSQGTFGTFTTDNGLTLVSGELPWKENQKKVSCIPAGTYTCVWHQSPSKGWVYQVLNVPNRDNILIHSGNYCGDVELGLESDFLGCIGLGLGTGQLNGQKCIINSHAAIEKFEEDMNQATFELTIEWADGVSENA